MSIFSSREKQAQTNTQQAETPVINPDILGKFNLTQEDINASYKNLEVENNKKEVAQQAIDYYNEIASGQISFADPKPVKLGEIALKPQVKETSEIADSLFSQVSQMEPAMHPKDLEHIKIYLSTFAENFGARALDANDWKTTINSYELATEGGIMLAPQVIQKLNEIYKEDKDTRIKIVELIQQKIDTRASNPKSTVTPPIAIPNSEPAPANLDTESTVTKPIPPTEIFPPVSQATQTPEPLVQPVGTPNSPILGERVLRPAPQNPNNSLP